MRLASGSAALFAAATTLCLISNGAANAQSDIIPHVLLGRLSAGERNFLAACRNGDSRSILGFVNGETIDPGVAAIGYVEAFFRNKPAVVRALLENGRVHGEAGRLSFPVSAAGELVRDGILGGHIDTFFNVVGSKKEDYERGSLIMETQHAVSNADIRSTTSVRVTDWDIMLKFGYRGALQLACRFQNAPMVAALAASPLATDEMVRFCYRESGRGYSTLKSWKPNGEDEGFTGVLRALLASGRGEIGAYLNSTVNADDPAGLDLVLENPAVDLQMRAKALNRALEGNRPRIARKLFDSDKAAIAGNSELSASVLVAAVGSKNIDGLDMISGPVALTMLDKEDRPKVLDAVAKTYDRDFMEHAFRRLNVPLEAAIATARKEMSQPGLSNGQLNQLRHFVNENSAARKSDAVINSSSSSAVPAKGFKRALKNMVSRREKLQ